MDENTARMEKRKSRKWWNGDARTKSRFSLPVRVTFPNRAEYIYPELFVWSLAHTAAKRTTLNNEFSLSHGHNSVEYAPSKHIIVRIVVHRDFSIALSRNWNVPVQIINPPVKLLYTCQFFGSFGWTSSISSGESGFPAETLFLPLLQSTTKWSGARRKSNQIQFLATGNYWRFFLQSFGFYALSIAEDSLVGVASEEMCS